MTKTMKPRILFAEIDFSRGLDDEQRIVEGYCFVNEDAGDGYVWERSAMEAASADYMTYGAVREMHGRVAAGTANNGVDELGITWDEKGAYFRGKIVDDAAWNKVKERVYKGFSCGIVPTEMQGNRVKSCIWPEVSIVDRPQDKDANIASYRAELGLKDEYEVEVIPEVETFDRAKWTQAKRDALPREDFGDPSNEAFPIADQEDVDNAARLIGHADDPEAVKKRIIKIAQRKGLDIPDAWKSEKTETATARRDFNSMMGANALSDEGYEAFMTLYDAVWQIQWDDSLEDKEAAVRDSVQQFADYLVNLVANAKMGDRAAFTANREPSADEITRAVEAYNAQRGIAPYIPATVERIELNGKTYVPESDLQRTPEISALLERLETATSELTTARAELAASKEEIVKLKDEPVPAKPVVRFTEAVERTFAANRAAEEPDEDTATAITKYRELLARVNNPPANENERRDLVYELTRAKSQLNQLGIDPSTITE